LLSIEEGRETHPPFRGRFLESRQTSKGKRGNQRGEDASF